MSRLDRGAGVLPGRGYTSRQEDGRCRRADCAPCLVNGLLSGADLVKRGNLRMRAQVIRMDVTVRCRGCSAWSRTHGTMGLMKGRVLVVDDDAALAEMLGIVLRGEGFEPTFVADGDKAMEAFRDTRPDLVLLDLMLPGSDGIDVCRQIRGESGVPIVMLTAKTDTVDIVLGLESGADDYILKPFKSKELVARIRARLRRTDEPAPEMLQIGDVSIDVAGHSVKRNGETLSLTPLEFDLLVALARKPRQVFTREVLLEQVWGYRHAADTRLVNVHVQRLRAKIEQDPEHPDIVVTVRGVGYKAGPG
jgi:two-component system response regulator MtrA